MAKTTPIILGMQTEITAFSIDAGTGEVGASITTTITVTDFLKEIDERKDLDEPKKEQIKEKVREVEKEPLDRNKMNDLKKWFENNAPYLKSIIDLITEILKKLP